MLVHHQEAKIIILDPHYEPGNWLSRATVVGAGLDFAACDRALDHVYAEMRTRYQRMAQGERAADFKPLYLVTDEMSALTGALKDAGRRLASIAQQGRKAKVYTILTPHGPEVKQMGLEGQGSARKNFVFIKLPHVAPADQAKPRVVEAWLGVPGDRESRFFGSFIVPRPRAYTGTPTLNPRWLRHGASAPESLGVSGGGGHGASLPRPTPDAARRRGFATHFGRGTRAAQHLAMRLLNYGYGTRKIGEFLPFATAQARALVNQTRAAHPELHGSRPQAGSPAELELVRSLTSS